MEINKEKWWAALQYQCPSCKKYLCFKLDRENETHYWKKCNECGFKRANEILWAEYRHENGKVFLRSNHTPNWNQVEIREVKKGIKVVKDFSNLKLPYNNSVFNYKK